MATAATSEVGGWHVIVGHIGGPEIGFVAHSSRMVSVERQGNSSAGQGAPAIVIGSY